MTSTRRHTTSSAHTDPAWHDESADGDPVERYLQEIGRFPLLGPAEELRLAKRVAAGDLDARRRMIETNLRLVVTIARRYRGQGLDFLDLIQEGTLGLMRAVDEYDWQRRVEFSSYAAWWIRHEITFAVSSTSRVETGPASLRRLAARRELREAA